MHQAVTDGVGVGRLSDVGVPLVGGLAGDDRRACAAPVLEGLALWLDAKLHVVLCVDAKDAGFCLGLTDEMGIGTRSLYFDVEVPSRTGRRRGQRIGGVGDFADLRQLSARGRALLAAT